MILRDWHCPRCGATIPDQVEPPLCSDCAALCEPICNGGCGHSRYRFADVLPPHDARWRDHVRVIDPREADGRPATSSDGDFNAPALVDEFNSPRPTPIDFNDRHRERRERRWFEQDRRYGRNRIWSTRGGR